MNWNFSFILFFPSLHQFLLEHQHVRIVSKSQWEVAFGIQKLMSWYAIIEKTTQQRLCVYCVRTSMQTPKRAIDGHKCSIEMQFATSNGKSIWKYCPVVVFMFSLYLRCALKPFCEHLRWSMILFFVLVQSSLLVCQNYKYARSSAVYRTKFEQTLAKIHRSQCTK